MHNLLCTVKLMYRIIVILIIATARWAEEALEQFQSVQNIAAARVALPTRKLEKNLNLSMG